MANPKLTGHRQEKLRTSASCDRNQESPTAEWARCVAMIAEKNQQAEMESEQKLSEEFQSYLIIR